MTDAYTEAPTAGSMILALESFSSWALMGSAFGVFVVPQAATELAPLLWTSGRGRLTYGDLRHNQQKDVKRLVAYASIVDVAFIGGHVSP